MPFDITRTLEVMDNHLSKSGYFPNVIVGEPKGPPVEPFTASIWMQKVEVVEVTLVAPREKHLVRIRIYKNMLEEPQADIETEMARVVSLTMALFYGDFDLGETVVNIDIAGMYGDPITAEWGYLELSTKMFRICDIDIPLIIDDSAFLAN